MIYEMYKGMLGALPAVAELIEVIEEQVDANIEFTFNCLNTYVLDFKTSLPGFKILFEKLKSL